MISDLLNKSVMNGDKRPHISFTSHIGAGSRSHVLFTVCALLFIIHIADLV